MVHNLSQGISKVTNIIMTKVDSCMSQKTI